MNGYFKQSRLKRRLCCVVSVKSGSRKESRSSETNQRCGSKGLCSCAKLRRISREQRHGPSLYGTIQRWSGFQNPGQIAEGLQPRFLGCLNQTVDHRVGLGAQRNVGKQEVLAADYKGLDTALCPVVTQLQPSVLQIPQEIRPLLFEVVQGFAQRGLKLSALIYFSRTSWEFTKNSNFFHITFYFTY